jgi:hypothetical protein
VTGTAVEDEYFNPFVAVWTPGSYREALSIYRDSGQTQLKQTQILNWLGHEILFRTPRFQGVGNRDRYTFYDVDGEGKSRQLATNITETGRATQLFTHDSLARLTARGLDLNTNGTLDAASIDALTIFDQRFTNNSGTWQSVALVQHYLQDNVAAATLVQRARSIVPAALPTNVISSNIVERPGGGVVITSVTLDRATGDQTTVINNQELGQVRARVERDRLVRSETQPGISTPRTFAYTPFGEVQLVSDPVTGNVTNTYDTVTRRLLTVTDSLGRQGVYDYYAGGSTNAGRIKGIRDAATNWTYFAYTLGGQLFRQWGVNTYPVEHEYDEVGRMIKMTTFRTLPGAVNWASSTWPNPPGGDITEWVYDTPSGLLERKIYADAGAGSKTTVYTYDSGNFLDTKTNGRGQVSDYSTDPDRL